MAYDYRQLANEIAGPGKEREVQAIAEYLHYNESLHMHEGIESRDPCSYCWLRAGRAVKTIRELPAEGVEQS